MDKKITGMILSIEEANKLVSLIGSTLIWDKAEPMMDIIRKAKPIYEEKPQVAAVVEPAPVAN